MFITSRKISWLQLFNTKGLVITRLQCSVCVYACHTRTHTHRGYMKHESRNSSFTLFLIMAPFTLTSVVFLKLAVEAVKKLIKWYFANYLDFMWIMKKEPCKNKVRILWLQFDLGPLDLIYNILDRKMISHLTFLVNQAFNLREWTPLIDF